MVAVHFKESKTRTYTLAMREFITLPLRIKFGLKQWFMYNVLMI